MFLLCSTTLACTIQRLPMSYDLGLPAPSYASQPDGLSSKQDQQEIGGTDLTSRKETVQPEPRSGTDVLLDEGFESAFPGRGEAIRQKYDQIAAKQGEPLAADWLGGVPTARADVRQTLQDILGSGAAAGAGQAAQDLIQLADATAIIIERPQEKQDAKLSIRDDTVTISAKIYLYGSGATKEVAEAYEQDIEAAWDAGPSGKRWRYTDSDTGKEYTVRFAPDAELYDPKDPSRTPGDAAGHSTPPNTDNFIEVDAATARSYVRGGDRGEWRGSGRGGKSLCRSRSVPLQFCLTTSFTLLTA